MSFDVLSFVPCFGCLEESFGEIASRDSSDVDIAARRLPKAGHPTCQSTFSR